MAQTLIYGRQGIFLVNSLKSDAKLYAGKGEGITNRKNDLRKKETDLWMTNSY